MSRLMAVLFASTCMLAGPGAAASASLPDGRAWEMVSPLDKNGGTIFGIGGGKAATGGVVQASADGQRITYASTASFGDPEGGPYGSQYVSTRDATKGWLAQNITTPMSDQAYELLGAGKPYRAFSLDLSLGLVSGGNNLGPNGIESPSLAGAPAGYENYYLYGLPGGALQPLLTSAPGVAPGEFRLKFLGDTPDLSHAVLSSSAALGEGAGNPPGLYEWERVPGEPPAGRFQPVSIPPTGPPLSDTELGGGGGRLERAISEDGSKVIWTYNGAQLYVREGIGTSRARTLQADAPAGNGFYLTASSDGSKVFFADNERLTADSTASGGGHGDLYMFEPEVGTAGRLVDLTVDTEDEGGAEVLGALGASADGSYLYFVANGVLSEVANAHGEKAVLGHCERGTSRPGARCNLYLWHAGWQQPRFIATLSANDDDEVVGSNKLGTALDWSSVLGFRTARVSHDGTRLVFMSQERLRAAGWPEGYDNVVSGGSSCGTDPIGRALPAQCEEVFLYEATADRLSCVSCNPSGARPVGPSGIPGGTEFALNQATYQSRVLSEGENAGRVFFDSADGLAPQDTNGVEDVYEYENGQTYLLSDGRSAQGASFVDASLNGEDAFFVTRAQLVAQDTDQQVDLYDARAPHEPGEAVGFPPASPVACAGEDCLAPSPATPGFAAPSSAVVGPSSNVVASIRVAKPKAKRKPKRRRGKRRRRAGRARKARTGATRSAAARGRS